MDYIKIVTNKYLRVIQFHTFDQNVSFFLKTPNGLKLVFSSFHDVIKSLLIHYTMERGKETANSFCPLTNKPRFYRPEKKLFLTKQCGEKEKVLVTTLFTTLLGTNTAV